MQIQERDPAAKTDLEDAPAAPAFVETQLYAASIHGANDRQVIETDRVIRIDASVAAARQHL
jgi:hypothetical protein